MRQYIIEIIGNKDGITVENLFNVIDCSYPDLNSSNLRVRKG